MVPFYGARIGMFYRTRLADPESYDVSFPDFSTPPVDQFRGFYADTAVDGSTPAIECAGSFYEEGRVVFGTDYPFGPQRGRAKLRTTIEAIERAALTDEERADLYAGNLRTLLG
jgi:aminocarboxymuconate-semialdehyde decarboxylase